MARESAVDTLARWRWHPDQFVREVFGVTPDPWQDLVLEEFPHCQRQAMKASKGPGKALDCGTIIPTPDGDRRFGDLVVGDSVFAMDGTVTRVLGVYPQGRRTVWRVRFDDGVSVLVDGDHLWKVKGATERRKDLDWSVLTTKQIIERGVRVKNGRWAGRQFEIPQHGAAQYPEAPQTVAPYLVGVWIGDGSRDVPSYTKPYIEVEREINQLDYATKRHANDSVRVLGWRVAELGEVSSCHSYNRFIPDEYKHGSIAQRQALLMGLMDTDGCIGDDGHMEYATTSQRLADDVVWLVRSLGGNAYQKKTIKRGWYHDDDGNRVDCRDCYRVTVRTTFNPFNIMHKAERWKDPLRNKSCSRYLTRYIDSIEPAGEAECMCIEVEHPSRCYLVNDFIVTHNTSVEAWLAWNFLLTRPHPKIAATSITGENLADNLWAEMSKWQQKSPLLQAAFEWQKTRVISKERPETWWMSARTWPKGGSAQDQANTLAGLHANYVMFVLDESGGIPDAVMASADAALSSCTEGHILQAGNPTHLSGPLYRACTSERRLWKVYEVNGDPDDPMRSPRVSVEWARQTIEKWGRNHPYVLINVFGQFPPASLNSLIGPDECTAAMKRSYHEWDLQGTARILGVDVARFGDDASVIFPRQGLVAFTPLEYRNLVSHEGAGVVARKWIDWKADATFVDDTGGYGAGWIDALVQLGRRPIGVGFSTSATNPRYANKRTEMYFDMVEWIRRGGQIPNCPELVSGLTETTYTFHKDRMLLEPKEMIKNRLGFSPDHADALGLTFAYPVAPKVERDGLMPMMQAEHDPYASMRSKTPQQMMSGYNPYSGMRGAR